MASQVCVEDTVEVQKINIKHQKKNEGNEANILKQRKKKNYTSKWHPLCKPNQKKQELKSKKLQDEDTHV